MCSPEDMVTISHKEIQGGEEAEAENENMLLMAFQVYSSPAIHSGPPFLPVPATPSVCLSATPSIAPAQLFQQPHSANRTNRSGSKRSKKKKTNPT